jgi:hypothetical protein
MVAMFPDSGVPYTDARNATDPATNCPAELWYSTSRCQPRFDPAAANAMLSEMTGLVNFGEVIYDCNNFTNAALSVRRQIQRGLPKFSNMTTTVTNFFAANLDPVATRYNNGMTLCVVPNTNNTGATVVNVNGLGNVYILRNDGSHIEANDLKAGIPYLISYLNGYFFLDGLVASQVRVPSFMTGDVDFWVRWDGNDYTGDGTANTPGKAFRTVQGCWQRVGGFFLPSPYFAINIRLGIPGDYEGPYLGQYGGKVRIIGDEGNAGAYRFKSMGSGVEGPTQSMWLAAINCEIIGICIANTGLLPVGPCGLVVELAASVMARNCIFRSDVSNNGGLNMWVRSTATLLFDHHNQYIGNNHDSYAAMLVSNNSVVAHTGGFVHHTLYFQDYISPTAIFLLSSLGSFEATDNMFSNNNCHGVKYNITGNSVLASHGSTMPGDINGYLGSGGQFL